MLVGYWPRFLGCYSNNYTITKTIAARVQVVVPTIQDTPVAQDGARNGLGVNSSDPFAKRLKTFIDIGVLKFFDDEGTMVTIKWIVHTQWMLYMMDFVATKNILASLQVAWEMHD